MIIDIYVALMVMYNKYIGTSKNSISVLVKFNMNIIFKGTI